MDNTVETATALLEKAKEDETAGKFQDAIDKINQAATILVELGAWGENELLTAQTEVKRLEELITSTNNISAEQPPKVPPTDASAPEAPTVAKSGKTVEQGTFLLEQAKEEEKAGQYQTAINKINAAAEILVEIGAWGEKELLNAQSDVKRLQGLMNSIPTIEKPTKTTVVTAPVTEALPAIEPGKSVEDGTFLIQQAQEEEKAGQYQAAIDKINAAAVILVERGTWGEDEIKAAQQEIQRLETLLTVSISTPVVKPPKPTELTPSVTEALPAIEPGKSLEDGNSLIQQAQEEEKAGQYQAAIDKINAAAVILVERGTWGEDEIKAAQQEIQRLETLLTASSSTPMGKPPELLKHDPVEEIKSTEGLQNHTVEFASNLLKEAKSNEQKAQYQEAIDKINQAATILVDLSAWGQDEIINAQEEVARLQSLLDSKSAIDKLSTMDEDGLAPIPISPPPAVKPPTPTTPINPPISPPTVKPPISAALVSPKISAQPPAPSSTLISPDTPPVSKRHSYDEGLPDLPISPSQKVKLAVLKLPKITKPIAPPQDDPLVPSTIAPIKGDTTKLIFTPPSEIPQDPDSADLGDALSFKSAPEQIKVPSSPIDIPPVPPRPSISNDIPKVKNEIQIPSEPVPTLTPPIPPTQLIKPNPQPTIPTIDPKPQNIREKRDPLSVLTQKTGDKVGFEEASSGLIFGGKITKPVEPLSNKPGFLLFGTAKPKTEDKSVLAQSQSKTISSAPNTPALTSVPNATEGSKSSGLSRLKAGKTGNSKGAICPMCGKMADKCNCGYMIKPKK